MFFPHVVPGKVDRQRITIRVNGYNAGSLECKVSESQALKLVVPYQVLQSDRMVVQFDLPDAISPSEIGTGPDPRQLSMGLYGFETELLEEGSK